MNCKIIATAEFRKDAKKLLKKFSSLKEELIQLEKQLLDNPRMGQLVFKNTYKIRLAVKSKGKGKSGGMRVITYVVEFVIDLDENNNDNEVTIFLAAIYDKSEMENISDKDLKNLIDEIKSELENE